MVNAPPPIHLRPDRDGLWLLSIDPGARISSPATI
jgi:hypothetical protein